MLQQDSLVLVDVAWLPLSTPNQCLVTWEVAGGGLMGNLLTESFNVQLSLWPDTKYRVQVTCKNKFTGTMTRSLPLTIDTAEAIKQHEQQTITEQTQTQSSLLTTLLPQQQHKVENSQLPQNRLEDLSDNEIKALNALEEENADDNNENDDEENDDNSIEHAIAPIMPYDDQSSETINQHTNFIFNWHARNNDISAIEPLHKPHLNVLTMAALADMQKPLLFGVIAGTMLLTFILFLYVCVVRQQRLPGDKTALITDDVHSVTVSMPPAAQMAAATSPIQQQHSSGRYIVGGMVEDVCKNPAICSRNTLKV